MFSRTALGLAVAALLAVDVGSAVAVQTSTFKLAATGPRTRLAHPAGSGAVHDSVVVADLSNKPLTINLGVIGVAAQPDGNFALGNAGQGFATHVHLATTTLSLKAHQSQVVRVVVDTPSHATQAEYAAITAQPVASASNGIGVQTRLALLVEVTAGAVSTSPHRSSGGGDDVIAPAIAAALIAAGLVALFARRRKMAA